MSVALTTEELLIGGKRTPAADGKTYETLNPATGEVLARVADASVEDAERAMRPARILRRRSLASVAGRAAAQSPAQDRALINERTNELPTLESKNCGKTIRDATSEVKGIAICFEYYAGAADKMFGETIPVRIRLDLTLREPIGVRGRSCRGTSPRDGVVEAGPGAGRGLPWY